MCMFVLLLALSLIRKFFFSLSFFESDLFVKFVPDQLIGG